MALCCPRCERSFDASVSVCPTCRPGDSAVHLVEAEELARTPQGSRYLLGRVLSERFRVDGYLGGGGMGAVYRARQLAVDREVALKAIRTDFLTDPGSRKRFSQEARVVAQLGHPHIAQLYDFGAHRLDQRSEPVHYMVMELVDGGALKDVLEAEGALSPARATSVARCVLLGLASAHAKGVVHRDLKPANILFDRRSGLAEHVKIVDFGLAKLLEGQEKDLTGSGTAFGTPEYMAPEQWRGEPVDGRTDIYAFGCMLYEMLTGQPPFVGPTPLSLASQHMDTQRPSLVRPDGEPRFPPPLGAVLEACLALEPRDRLPRADDVLELLDGANVRTPSSPRYTPRPVSRPLPGSGQATVPWRAAERGLFVDPAPPGGTDRTGEDGSDSGETPLLSFSLDELESLPADDGRSTPEHGSLPEATADGVSGDRDSAEVLIFEPDGRPEQALWRRPRPDEAGGADRTPPPADSGAALQVGRVRTRKASAEELRAESPLPVGPANSSWPNAPVHLRSSTPGGRSPTGDGERQPTPRPWRPPGARNRAPGPRWDRWLITIALIAGVVALSVGLSDWWSDADRTPATLSFVPDVDGGPVAPGGPNRALLARWQRVGGPRPGDGGPGTPAAPDGASRPAPSLPPRQDGGVLAEDAGLRSARASDGSSSARVPARPAPTDRPGVTTPAAQATTSPSLPAAPATTAAPVAPGADAPLSPPARSPGG